MDMSNITHIVTSYINNEQEEQLLTNAMEIASLDVMTSSNSCTILLSSGERILVNTSEWANVFLLPKAEENHKEKEGWITSNT